MYRIRSIRAAVLGAYYLPIAEDAVYHVKVVAAGPVIKVYLNNVLRIQAVNTQYSRGKVGLFVYDAADKFEHLSVAAESGV